MSSPLDAIRASATASQTATAERPSVDREAFLKLLVAQLSNQDPLKPMEGTEFVSQLSQFALVEQALDATPGPAVGDAVNRHLCRAVEALAAAGFRRFLVPNELPWGLSPIVLPGMGEAERRALGGLIARQNRALHQELERLATLRERWRAVCWPVPPRTGWMWWEQEKGGASGLAAAQREWEGTHQLEGERQIGRAHV